MSPWRITYSNISLHFFLYFRYSLLYNYNEIENQFNLQSTDNRTIIKQEERSLTIRSFRSFYEMEYKMEHIQYVYLHSTYTLQLQPHSLNINNLCLQISHFMPPWKRYKICNSSPRSLTQYLSSNKAANNWENICYNFGKITKVCKVTVCICMNSNLIKLRIFQGSLKGMTFGNDIAKNIN